MHHEPGQIAVPEHKVPILRREALHRARGERQSAPLRHQFFISEWMVRIVCAAYINHLNRFASASCWAFRRFREKTAESGRSKCSELDRTTNQTGTRAGDPRAGRSRAPPPQRRPPAARERCVVPSTAPRRASFQLEKYHQAHDEQRARQDSKHRAVVERHHGGNGTAEARAAPARRGPQGATGAAPIPQKPRPPMSCAPGRLRTAARSAARRGCARSRGAGLCSCAPPAPPRAAG